MKTSFLFIVLATFSFGHAQLGYHEPIAPSLSDSNETALTNEMPFNDQNGRVVDVETTDLDISKIDNLAANLFHQDIWFESDSIVTYYNTLPKSEIPQFTDEEIIAMMRLMPTQIPLDFNTEVRKYIDVFSTHRRTFISKALGLSYQYFPLYEEVFDRNNMPLELKYLSVIESGLNPTIKSPVGATGLWQFMLRTGQAYGLDVNSSLDERSDPMLATEASSRFLGDLYKIYGDWLLSLASYNAGPGNVNKAIARSGGKRTYWEIRPYLPRETQNYVPQFIAVAFLMHYHETFLIQPLAPVFEIAQTDTVLIKDQVSLGHIAKHLGLNKDYLVLINPSLKTEVIPNSVEGYNLHLPYNFLGQFIEKQDTIFKDPTINEIEVIAVAEPEYTIHKVKSGDTLGHIAARYGVGVSKIKSWNGLSGDFLSVGQKLRIYN